MARATGSVRVVYDRVPAMSKAMRRNRDRIVRASAMRVALAAKLKTPPRVDTGEMLQGWAVEQVKGDSEVAVVNSAAHHIYNELGTVNMAAHPMLIPAAAEDQPRFIAEMRKLLETGR
jgi:HK97 gp10 family phage protein